MAKKVTTKAPKISSAAVVPRLSSVFTGVSPTVTPVMSTATVKKSTPTPSPSPQASPKPSGTQSGASSSSKAEAGRVANRKSFQSNPDKKLQNQITQLTIASQRPGISSSSKADLSRSISRAKATQVKRQDPVFKARQNVIKALNATREPGLSLSSQAERQRTLSRARAGLTKAYDAKKPKDKDPNKNNNSNNKPSNNKNNNNKGPVTKKKKKKKKTTKPNTKPNTTTTTTEDEGDPGYDFPIVDPTPFVPPPRISYETDPESGVVKQIKSAGPELLVIDESSYPAALLEKLMFEDIAGVEILSLTRHDLVNGADIQYQQISNLGKISTIYGGANLIALQNTSEQVFRKYPIKLSDYLPTVTADPLKINRPVYMDSAGSVIIEVANAVLNEEVDVQFITSSNDTIY